MLVHAHAKCLIKIWTCNMSICLPSQCLEAFEILSQLCVYQTDLRLFYLGAADIPLLSRVFCKHMQRLKCTERFYLHEWGHVQVAALCKSFCVPLPFSSTQLKLQRHPADAYAYITKFTCNASQGLLEYWPALPIMTVLWQKQSYIALCAYPSPSEWMLPPSKISLLFTSGSLSSFRSLSASKASCSTSA